MASTIKVDNVQNQPGTNIINKCGTTITLGASSDTVALAAGATQTGFGRTGTVDWITTPKVTGDSPITAATGSGYFLNTTAGTITINLPAGAAGSIVSMADYAATWHTNNVTVAANGSEKIGGEATDATLNTEGQSVTFVYVDSVQGWVNTMDSTSNVRGIPPFIQATGGTPTQSGDYEIRTFTGPGTFCVTSLSPSAPENAVDYLIVGGAGGADGGSGYSTSGGGAGGYRESPGAATCYTASPLGASPAAAVTVTVQSYAVVVGAGGVGISTCAGTPVNQAGGNVSSVFSLTGAAGGSGNPGGAPTAGNPGGSGGGGSGNSPPAAAGAGNTPPTNPSQGNAGGPAVPSSVPGGVRAGGGGGGAGGVGGTGAAPNVGGGGGVGTPSQITGGAVSYAGGGGGTNQNPGTGSGGAASPCGTGGAAALGSSNPSPGGAGSINKGGGGGAGFGAAGGTGGSGVVIIRYKFQ